MKAKHSKEKISARGLPVSGAKAVVIERLTTALNYNTGMVDVSKIATPLPLLRSSKNTRNNNRRHAEGQEVPVNLTRMLLEQDERNTATANKNLTACSPTYPVSSESSFT